MKNTRKCGFSLLLALTMVLLLFPSAAFAADGVAVSATNFPDSAFRKQVNAFDKNKDGYLSATEITAVKKIELNNMGITTLKGVEHFTALTWLDVWGNELTSLDLSKNIKLDTLFCADNKLTSLNITGCTALVFMTCSNNQLTSLDVSKNTKLTSLDCTDNKLKNLSVSKNTKLYDLQCGGNQISQLDLRSNPLLIHAVKKGEKTVDSGRTSYWMSQSAGYIPVLYSVVIDSSTVLQTGSVDPPSIRTAPQSKTVVAGKTVTFTVKAAGEGLTYQWYYVKEVYGTRYKLSGKTSPTLSFTAKASQNGYRYFCEISNKAGVTYTWVAKLTVQTTPKISAQPSAKTVAAGKTVTFKVKASGEKLNYQWFCLKKGSSNWTKMSGKTSATLSFTARKSQNGYKYKCLVKNAAGSVYSRAAKLTVK